MLCYYAYNKMIAASAKILLDFWGPVHKFGGRAAAPKLVRDYVPEGQGFT